ncbi:hypothetical protein [Lysinibacillus sp. G4S2]|uniref:hypothetical protein n=1 Tax=Lysinibacillus sp. G4S2 TaxID=3055859 RepID=UPI0025A2CA9D|nr:hypothetical protein [Lysinibacillus sp. G4S2]MDM5247062.1 hypothetical protein [Lysinibacillus sp. G4S2]
MYIAEVALCPSTILLVDLVEARIVAATSIGACGTGTVPLFAACIDGVFILGSSNIDNVIACFNKH